MKNRPECQVISRKAVLKGTLMLLVGVTLSQAVTLIATAQTTGLIQVPPQAVDVTKPAPCAVLDAELVGGQYSGTCNALNMAHGLGLAISLDGKTRYQGEFVHGAKQGFGRKDFSSGDSYTGLWVQDRRVGLGTYVYGQQSPWAGDRYEGQWLDDQMHGMGTYSWAMGDVYSGRWIKNLQADGVTSGQARRAVYLRAFLAGLKKTGNQICPASHINHSIQRASTKLGSEVNSTAQPANTSQAIAAKATQVLGDRVFVSYVNLASLSVQTSPTLSASTPSLPNSSWQLVSDWIPCENSSSIP